MKTTMSKPQTIQLSESETEAYEDSGPDGDVARRTAKEGARLLADASGKPVEIHSHDGICFEQILPEVAS